MTDKLVFIASPYANGDRNDWALREANVKRSIFAAHVILDAGLIPVAPLLCHFLNIQRRRPEDTWRHMSRHLLLRCDACLRLAGASEGADDEVALACAKHIPVFEQGEHPIAWIVELIREHFFVKEAMTDGNHVQASR